MRYDEQPRFTFYGGLVFQPLNFNLYASYSFDDRRLRQLYSDFISKGLFKKIEDIVVLTRIESDQLTTRMGGFKGMVVEKVNDTPIKNLKHLHEILSAPNPPEFHVIEFNGGARPLVIPTKEAAEAQKRIMKQVGISSAARLEN